MMFSLIFWTMNCASLSVTMGPDGRQRPVLNNCSLTPFVNAGLEA